MALQFTVIPSERFADGTVTVPALRRAANPTIEVTGDTDAADIADGAVTAVKLHIDALAFATDSASTDAYEIEYPDAQKPSAYADGQQYFFRAATANTGACTLDVNGLGAKAIKLPGGVIPLDGTIPGDGYVLVQYAEDQDCFLLLSASANPGILRASGVVATHDTVLSVTTTTYTITLDPFLSAIPTGLVIHGLIDAANQGAVVIVLTVANAAGSGTTDLASQPLKKYATQALVANDLIAGQGFTLIYDGTNFQLLTPVAYTISDNAVRDIGRSIVMAYATASTATLAADEIVLRNSSNQSYRAATVAVTVNFGVNGANGLEYNGDGSAKTKVADTWYWFWLIYNGTTVAGLASTSATAPTLPAGYTYQALVCAIRTDASANLVPTAFRNGAYIIDDSAVIPVVAGVRTFQHPFGVAPSHVEVVYRCTTADIPAGLAVGDEVPYQSFRSNSSDFAIPYSWKKDASTIKVLASNAYSADQGTYIWTTGVFGPIVEANYTLRIYVRL